MKRKYKLLIVLTAVILLLVTSSYTAWNTLDPDYTCAQCHEIKQACNEWRNSTHVGVACTECHGSALSNGVSGLTSKIGMVYTHFTSRKTHEDLSLNEQQSLQTAARCAECHQAEHAKWLSGAHSTTYSDIFSDIEHNRMEKPYWDCFRCHGMFYDGDITELMFLEGNDPAQWYIKDDKQAAHPAITCLACHQVHAKQDQHIPYAELNTTQKEELLKKTTRPATALYMRSERRHIPSTYLTQVEIIRNDTLLHVTDDPNAWLCMQCHASNAFHSAGSADDKTPVGLFEGMSCLDCHDPHSNKVRNAYRNVHNQDKKEY